MPNLHPSIKRLRVMADGRLSYCETQGQADYFYTVIVYGETCTQIHEACDKCIDDILEDARKSPHKPEIEDYRGVQNN